MFKLQQFYSRYNNYKQVSGFTNINTYVLAVYIVVSSKEGQVRQINLELCCPNLREVYCSLFLSNSDSFEDILLFFFQASWFKHNNTNKSLNPKNKLNARVVRNAIHSPSQTKLK